MAPLFHCRNDPRYPVLNDLLNPANRAEIARWQGLDSNLYSMGIAAARGAACPKSIRAIMNSIANNPAFSHAPLS
jgi:hypothetical protein